MQEDKEALFDAIDTLALELPIAAGVIRTLQVNAARTTAALDGAMLATDLADYLVRKGVPFRESHHLIGQVVRRAEELGVSLMELDITEYQRIHPAFGKDTYEVLSFQRSVEARDIEGGTAPTAVRVQIERAKGLLDQH
jgi:argininosuccinate lyase